MRLQTLAQCTRTDAAWVPAMCLSACALLGIREGFGDDASPGLVTRGAAATADAL